MKKNIEIDTCSSCAPEVGDRAICKGCEKEYEMVHLDLDTIEGQVAIQGEEHHEEREYFERQNSKLLIKWDDKYMLGIAEIDQQHKEIVDLINSIHESINSGKRDQKFVLEILKKLDTYVENHFAYEEKLFKASKYPGYTQQVREHRVFSSQVSQLHKEFEKSFFDLRSVLRFMVAWFMEHTQGCDKQFVQYWKEQVTK